ncbi:TetR family transcriptional regulator [Longispora fulva]|uniref:AcrR family transcriptional regulator n=1 Tax=Longispora fulva TaxID=619741 RepID=A0A8J7GRW2_9ACTN|nr:TetR/AcrR family transcriptional regulator [Longispora fulva]MBG6137579.1 AcrR family transcriptional regulator [Longispora fulva]GIG61066.1 TetR family transcriptional regulator [Longispora fulva]
MSSSRGVGEHYQGDLRRTLLEAAGNLLAEVGADGVSLREVARRAGVSHAAPAHHFRDRAGLFTALATEGFELFDQHLRAALATEPRQPFDQLPALGRAYAEFAEVYPGHFAVMFRPALIQVTDPGFAAASDAAFETLRRHVERCQRAGWHATADTQALAAVAWALAHGITALRAQGSLARHYPDVSLDGVVALVGTLLHGESAG